MNAAGAEEQGASAAADGAPHPRRTRRGEVIVGPTVMARYRPGALYGLPLLSLLLSPFAAIAVQQWRLGRLRSGADGLLDQLLAPAWTQLVIGALLLWALFALWALVPMLLTHRAIRVDPDAGTLTLHKGLRTVATARIEDVLFAVGEPERGSLALIGLRDPAEPAELQRQWVINEIGWDAAGFDGLRVLQAAAGLPPAPPRDRLIAENRRVRRAGQHRELATRLGMPWKDEYEHDEAAFQAEFDRVRRVLGGKQPARDGDPVER